MAIRRYFLYVLAAALSLACDSAAPDDPDTTSALTWTALPLPRPDAQQASFLGAGQEVLHLWVDGQTYRLEGQTWQPTASAPPAAPDVPPVPPPDAVGYDAATSIETQVAAQTVAPTGTVMLVTFSVSLSPQKPSPSLNEVFLTSDGGATWSSASRGLLAYNLQEDPLLLHGPRWKPHLPLRNYLAVDGQGYGYLLLSNPTHSRAALLRTDRPIP